MLRLKDALRLYVKKKRSLRGYLRHSIIQLAAGVLPKVSKIQGLIRTYLARK